MTNILKAGRDLVWIMIGFLLITISVIKHVVIEGLPKRWSHCSIVITLDVCWKSVVVLGIGFLLLILKIARCLVSIPLWVCWKKPEVVYLNLD